MEPLKNTDSEIDQLTGMVGRAAFRRRVSESLQDAAAPSLLAIDLDRFKNVNNSVGHETGDQVLQRVAKRIRGAIGAEGFAGRTSGDEFAVLLPCERDPHSTADRLLDIISRPYAVNGHIVTISASVGIAKAPQDGSTPEALMQSATLALHQAEKDGRNRYKNFEMSMLDKANLQFALEKDLRAAIALQQVELRSAMALEQFAMYYQPKLKLATERIIGFEALIRWQHPKRGMVGPDSFVPIAEEIGLIGQMGTWSLRTACKSAAGWPQVGVEMPVSVNVSPHQVREGRGFLTSVIEALSESGLPPSRLVLEITESAVLGAAASTLDGIRNLGVRLCIDDFGTGYSSLNHLSQFKFDEIKIDRSFLRELGRHNPATGASASAANPNSARAAWMIRAIAGLGSGLGLMTVAEGVETHEQANIVRMAGVEVVQGWLYGKAVPETMVAELIENFGARPMNKGASA